MNHHLVKYKRVLSLYKLSGVYDEKDSNYINLYKFLRHEVRNLNQYRVIYNDSGEDVSEIFYGKDNDNIIFIHEKYTETDCVLWIPLTFTDRIPFLKYHTAIDGNGLRMIISYYIIKACNIDIVIDNNINIDWVSYSYMNGLPKNLYKI